MAVMRLVDAALRCQRPRGRYGYIAPLLKQAKGIAWDYLKAEARKVPGTTINEGELWVEFPNGARIRIYGADNPDALRGLYFDGVVIDEVAQIKKELWVEVIRPTLNDRAGWALFIGTPKGINLFSELFYAAQVDPEWFATSYNVYETDALQPDEIASSRKGQSEAVWKQEYLCDFTASSENNLIPIEDALAAAGRHLRDEAYNFAPRILGVDVAWQGGDRNVIVPRQGLASFKPHIYPGLPEKVFAGHVARAIEVFRNPNGTAPTVFVDTTGGYGGEVVSRLRDWGHQVEPVVFSWKASDERFGCLRDEMWFKMAGWLKEAAIFNSPELIAELCAPTFSNDNAANKLKVESKDDIRAKLNRSPDIADALALTFAFPVATPAGAFSPFGGQARHAATEWDPFAEDRR